MKRLALALSMFSFVVLSSATVFSKEGPKVVNANAFGSTPNITIRTVQSGAAPWVVDNGRIQLSPSGKLKVRITGLVIGEGALANGDPVPANLVGTVATVTTVHAALTCGGPGGGTPFTVTSTDAVPISSSGDVEITAQLTIPSVCAQPIVLIRIGAAGETAGPWIAASELPGAPRN